MEPSGQRVALEAREDSGAITVTSGGVVVLRQHAGPNQRPFIHPLVSPGGAGTVTEDAPAHHPWQHGLYFGLNDVNGVGFWTEGLLPGRADRDGAFDSRIHSAPTVVNGDVRWAVATDYRDLDGSIMLEDVQDWRLAACDDRLDLDVTWTLRARRDVVFGKYEYGGLFLRMPFRSDRGGSAVDSNGDSESGQRARWVSVRMPLAETGREVLVAVLDHPANPGSPVPWRIDDELGIGPAPSAAGSWMLDEDTRTCFRYRVVVFGDVAQPAAVAAAWDRYWQEVVA